MSLISHLLQTLPSPKEPKDVAVESQWEQVENKLGLLLPSDYKIVVKYYGHGIWGDYLITYSPFSDSESSNLFGQIEFVKRVYSVHPYVDFDIYPAQGGLLILGHTPDADHLYWDTTERNPDQWTLLLRNVKTQNFERYDMGFVEFILNLYIPKATLFYDLLESSNMLREQFDRKAPFIASVS